MKFMLAEDLSNQPAGTLFYPLREKGGELRLGELQMLISGHDTTFRARQLGPAIIDQVHPHVAYRDYAVRWVVSAGERFLVLEKDDVLGLICQLTQPTSFYKTQEPVPVPTAGELSR